MTDIVVSIKGFANSYKKAWPIPGQVSPVDLDGESIFSIEGSNIEELSDTARSVRVKDLVTRGILRFAIRTKNSTSQALAELESYVARTAVESENNPEFNISGEFTLTINGEEQKFEIKSAEQLINAFTDLKAKIENSIEAARVVQAGAPRFRVLR